MPILREILDGLSKTHDSSVDWMELVRDLEAQISIQPPAFDFSVRWAEKADLLAIDAMQGFVKEIEFMESALDRGDKCLLLERSAGIRAFAWVTFRDYRLSLWHTMRLPLGFAYLVYIHVEPEYRRRGVGTYLLNCLMLSLREDGYRRLISGMYGDWESSIRLHVKSGFRICRKYTERRILRFFPYPPKVTELDG
jgi:ribosomal protein S18 acetylase RimI-like enzyme